MQMFKGPVWNVSTRPIGIKKNKKIHISAFSEIKSLIKAFIFT